MSFNRKRKTLYFQDWYESGFQYVKDLVNVRGFKALTEISNELI